MFDRSFTFPGISSIFHTYSVQNDCFIYNMSVVWKTFCSLFYPQHQRLTDNEFTVQTLGLLLMKHAVYCFTVK